MEVTKETIYTTAELLQVAIDDKEAEALTVLKNIWGVISSNNFLIIILSLFFIFFFMRIFAPSVFMRGLFSIQRFVDWFPMPSWLQKLLSQWPDYYLGIKRVKYKYIETAAQLPLFGISTNKKESFNSLFLMIDQDIIKKTREKYPIWNTQDAHEVACNYDKIIQQILNKKLLTDKSVDYIIRNIRYLIDYEVGLTIKIGMNEEAVNSLALEFDPTSYISIENPQLMWDCTCDFDTKLCPIHCPQDNPKRKVTFSNGFSQEDYFYKLAQTSGITKIQFDDITILWNDQPNLWPPSIDVFNLILDLKKEFSQDKEKEKITSIMDIGCGTGALGIWFKKKFSNINKLIFTDFLYTPLFYTRMNCSENQIDEQNEQMVDFLCIRELAFNNELQRRILSTNQGGNFQKLSLIICNPPYLPTLGFHNIGFSHTVFGTFLLEQVLMHFHQFANELVISFSDIVLQEAKAILKNIEDFEIGKHVVPFRVPQVLGNEKYMKRLLDERSKHIIIIPRESPEYIGYRIMHTIRTYRIQAKI